MKRIYAPKQGDIVLVDFNPQKGHEQKGTRPALVVSNAVFNEKTGFVLVCPITTKNNKFPLHIPLPEHARTKGCILTEQVKSIDFQARNTIFLEKVPTDFLEHISAILESFYR